MLIEDDKTVCHFCRTLFFIGVLTPRESIGATQGNGTKLADTRCQRSLTLINCFECRTPRIEVREDKLVVKKGFPDQTTITQLGRQLGVDSFLFVEVYRTRFSLISQVTLLQASDGAVIGSTQVKMPALDWSEAGLQLTLALGPGFVSGGGQSGNSSDTGYNFGGHFSAMEEVGFGKAGLILGGVSGPQGSLAYLIPSVAWRGRFGTSGIYSLTTIGAGFATSAGAGGLGLRADYTLMLGSFTVLGVDATTMLPIQNNSSGSVPPLNFAGMFFIGFALGR